MMELIAIVIAVMLGAGGLILLLHHGYKHGLEDEAKSSARRESCCIACYFQVKDVVHFETWTAVSFSSALCMVVGNVRLHRPHPSAQDTLEVVLECVAGCVLALFCVVQHARKGCAAALREVAHNFSNHETWILVAWFGAIAVVASSYRCSFIVPILQCVAAAVFLLLYRSTRDLVSAGPDPVKANA